MHTLKLDTLNETKKITFFFLVEKLNFVLSLLHATATEHGHTNFRHMCAPSTRDPPHHSEVGKRGVTKGRLRHLCLEAAELSFKMLLEGLAQPVKSKGIHTGITESQHPRENGDNERNGRGVLIAFVSEGVVEVQEVGRQPADSEQSHQHQDCFGNSLPGLNLYGEKIAHTQKYPFSWHRQKNHPLY